MNSRIEMILYHVSDQLHERDEEIRACCDAKNKLMIELLRVYSDTEESHGVSKDAYLEETEDLLMRSIWR